MVVGMFTTIVTPNRRPAFAISRSIANQKRREAKMIIHLPVTARAVHRAVDQTAVDQQLVLLHATDFGSDHGSTDAANVGIGCNEQCLAIFAKCAIAGAFPGNYLT